MTATEQQTNWTSRTSDIGAVYEANRRLLVGTAVKRFGIGETDAETLVHDVFIAYMIKADEVLDARSWLVGAVCNASKHFLRTQSRAVGLPDDFVEEPDPSSLGLLDRLPNELAARECFDCITPRCQLALRLRYIEGYSIPEIAAELGTSAKYAQKLVSRCLQQAHQRYRTKGTP